MLRRLMACLHPSRLDKQHFCFLQFLPLLQLLAVGNNHANNFATLILLVQILLANLNAPTYNHQEIAL